MSDKSIEKLNSVEAYKVVGLGDKIKPTICIGGAATEKFVPNLNISFACQTQTEQYWLNVNRASVVVRNEKASVADQLSLTVGTETDLWHIDERGRLKWDIQFSRPPATNVFSWKLKHSPGLSFHYQPPLTSYEIARGWNRPEEAIGSYAVYGDRAGRFEDRKGVCADYGTGKLLHLYRPLCRDAVGKEIWANLLIEDSVLSITIPQDYLDHAVYPLTLDPTFGVTSVGASEGADYANQMEGFLVTTPADISSVSKMSLYSKAGADIFFKTGVWLKSGGTTHALISNGVGGIGDPDTSWAWVDSTFSTPPAPASSTEHIIGIVVSDMCEWRYDHISGYTNYWHPENSYSAPGSLVDPQLGPDAYIMSLFATYSAATALAFPPLFSRHQNTLLRR